MRTEEKQRRLSKKHRQKRKRKRLLRRLILWGYRIACITIALAILLLAGKLFRMAESEIMRKKLSEEYPESLVALLERNPETEDFVLHYLENKDKEFEIDLSGEIEKGTIPLFLQWDERWGYTFYGSDFLAITGCGPTCLSMVRCGLSGDGEWNPKKVAQMAEAKGYYIEGAGSSWELMTTGARELGLEANQVIYDESHILAELEAGNPIISIMGPGDFTTSGHFIVLTGIDEEGLIKICDPNSKINSEKHWKLEDIMPQIKNLWSYTCP